jgi:hypothetical protein
MRMPQAPLTPNAATESGQLIRSSLVVRVRMWEELPENEHQEHYTRCRSYPASLAAEDTKAVSKEREVSAKKKRL